MNAYLATIAKKPLKFASPKRPYSPSEATAVAGSANTDQHHLIADKIAKAVGLSPVKSRDAVHDTPQNSIPGISQAIYGEGSPETARYAAAWYGLISQVPSLAVFHVGDGPDRVHKWHQVGGSDEVRRSLDEAGIRSRVLMPEGDGFDVMVYDPGQGLTQNVQSHSAKHGTQVESSSGQGELIGGEANGPAASGQSRQHYRQIISDYESGQSQPQQPVKAWRYARGEVDSTESGILKHIRHVGPGDTLPPLVLADHLDESGHSTKAGLIRESVADSDRGFWTMAEAEDLWDKKSRPRGGWAASFEQASGFRSPEKHGEIWLHHYPEDGGRPLVWFSGTKTIPELADHLDGLRREGVQIRTDRHPAMRHIAGDSRSSSRGSSTPLILDDHGMD